MATRVGASSDEPRREPAPVAGPRRKGLFGFVGESASELKKVEWPNQNQVIQGTVVVLIACIIVGTFLWVNDQIWQEVVKKVLL
jgi:preprotein translocase subunit SecE